MQGKLCIAFSFGNVDIQMLCGFETKADIPPRNNHYLTRQVDIWHESFSKELRT